MLGARLDPASIFVLNQNVDEGEAAALFTASAKVLGLSWEGLCDAYGERWCVTYAPRIYKAFYAKHRNTREFMLDINNMHARMTAAIPDARPPRYEIKPIGDDALLVTYRSSRHLIDLAVGLARGMVVYFGENVRVEKLSDTQFRMTFEGRSSEAS